MKFISKVLPFSWCALHLLPCTYKNCRCVITKILPVPEKFFWRAMHKFSLATQLDTSEWRTQFPRLQRSTALHSQRYPQYRISVILHVAGRENSIRQPNSPWPIIKYPRITRTTLDQKSRPVRPGTPSTDDICLNSTPVVFVRGIVNPRGNKRSTVELDSCQWSFDVCISTGIPHRLIVWVCASHQRL